MAYETYENLKDEKEETKSIYNNYREMNESVDVESIINPMKNLESDSSENTFDIIILNTISSVSETNKEE